jgi:hypothetical protein
MPEPLPAAFATGKGLALEIRITATSNAPQVDTACASRLWEKPAHAGTDTHTPQTRFQLKVSECSRRFDETCPLSHESTTTVQ